VQEAAEVLDTSVDAVRMRVRRGALESDKGEDGRVYVWSNPDELGVKSQRQVDGAGELIEELRDRVHSLERRLDEERDARRRADTIIAQLTQANAALAARVPELEAPAQDTPHGAPHRPPEPGDTPADAIDTAVDQGGLPLGRRAAGGAGPAARGGPRRGRVTAGTPRRPTRRRCRGAPAAAGGRPSCHALHGIGE
jgi:hypothetical protein